MSLSPLDEEDGAITSINITPFVDVVLVLLVIFMVTAPALVNHGLLLQLPKAATAKPLKPSRPLVVSVLKEGSYLLNGKPSTLRDIHDFIAQQQFQNSDQTATIAADKGVIYDAVVRVMDQLRQDGVTNFALQLERGEL